MKYVEECKVFKPFPLSTDVCDTCGGDKETHAEKQVDMLPYKEAVWKFFMEHGGVYNYYGGYGHESGAIRKHVAECGLNLDEMDTPEMETDSEFAGTFTDSDEISILKGYIVCNCGKYQKSKFLYERTEWSLRDMKLGQVIWHVVKAGESK